MAAKRVSLLKGLLFTTFVWGGLLLIFVLVSDFDAERGCSGVLGTSRCRPTMCGFIRGLVPGAADAPCWLLNALPFALVPGVVLWRIVQNEARLLLGRRSQAR